MIRAAALLLAAGLAAPALAGDASGFDPASIDQCLAAAPTQGARADCAGIGMEACLAYAKGKYSGDDPDFPMANCLDASHQAWEAKLTATYDAALTAEGTKPQEMLRRAERSWLQFREDLCNQARAAAPEGQGELAAARCLRDETARQTALLLALEPAE
ncbi:lysozyme inhibitor LprI family protein [Paracoccus aminovorans]|uniref:lysozyme inhibitor LprI family protein n=1 Tax=Paracoccus aminovorans TaxID=34004 RepID=UPI0007827420|nr:lysozyme inhibitor LprI family protein [Paracoccus aminovorans]